MMKKIYTILFLLVMPVFVSYGQIDAEHREVLTSLHDHYKNISTFSFDVRYNLYKGHSGKIPAESYPGFYQKESDKIYQRTNDIEIIYEKDYSLQIDHNSRSIFLSKSALSMTDILGSDVNSFLELCNSVELKSNTSGGYSCIFNIKGLSGVPFSAMALEFNSKWSIHKIIYYYSNHIDFSKKYNEVDYDVARLELVLSNFSTSNKSAKSPGMNEYLIKENGAWVASQKYSGYRLYNYMDGTSGTSVPE